MKWKLADAHRFRLRPGYGSKLLLIEFRPERADDAFFDDLLAVLRIIDGRTTDLRDVWMNDEVWLFFESDFGPFMLTRDVWDLVFIMADKNQRAILAIVEVLRSSTRFREEIVNHEDYK